jgi:octaprenyl-diphosphate synthase
MDVIYGKTAQLFVAATETGAVLGNESYRTAMKDYALHFGAAFQIIDDVMDYTSSADVMGKNLGDDLAEGKPTLPLIQAMKVARPEQAQQIRNAIKTGGLEHLDAILVTVNTSGALDYCRQRAAEESELAIKALAQVPDSIYKNALVGLAQLALSRVS